MTPRKLTTASYLVLGMVELLQPVTPYELKTFAAQSVVNFWSLPHTQIYAQCDRLLEDGHLAEQREPDGRRRRSFSITEQGKAALDAWRHEPTDATTEIRDLATLKLFFGADPKQLAEHQLRAHQAKLEEYLALREVDMPAPGLTLALEVGIGHEQEFVRYWTAVRDGEDPPSLSRDPALQAPS